MKPALAAAMFAIMVVGCSSSDPEAASQTSSSVSSNPTGVPRACGIVLATIDDVPVRSNGGCQTRGCDCAAGDTGYGYPYQCVEFAQRYYKQIFGIPAGDAHWPGTASAWQMCDSAQTYLAGSTTVHRHDGYVPVHGDLMVFGTGAGDGHVAIVDGVSGSSVSVYEQNSSWTGMNADALGSERCFIHANANTNASAAAPCSDKGYDSQYCGSVIGLDPSTLYVCRGRQLQAYQRACSQGCVAIKGADPDYCEEDTTNGCPCVGEDVYQGHVESTQCGSQVCGYDHQLWICGATGYVGGGGSC